MQAGVINNLSKQIDLGTPYILSSPNLLVTLPDGTPDSTVIPTVSPDVNVSSNPHTFSYIYVPSVGGMYTGKYQFLYGSRTLNYPFTFWATWTDVYSNIRSILGMTTSTLPNARIDIEFIALYVEMKAFTRTALPDYNTFNSIYQLYFDMGMEKLISSRLRASLGGKAPTGELTLMKKGTTTAQWSKSQPNQRKTIEETWWEQGIAILDAQIPEISAVLASDRSGDETMTRGDLALGNIHDFLQSYSDMYSSIYPYYGVRLPNLGTSTFPESEFIS